MRIKPRQESIEDFKNPKAKETKLFAKPGKRKEQRNLSEARKIEKDTANLWVCLSTLQQHQFQAQKSLAKRRTTINYRVI